MIRDSCVVSVQLKTRGVTYIKWRGRTCEDSLDLNMSIVGALTIEAGREFQSGTVLE